MNQKEINHLTRLVILAFKLRSVVVDVSIFELSLVMENISGPSLAEHFTFYMTLNSFAIESLNVDQTCLVSSSLYDGVRDF